mmetsp:Transcript_14700/g.27240  ORF Transcript_14700/g.27240 Transcript_14700/m.27240 type:complete len:209 (-) Transcript_14700:1703-2329(-)
MRRLVRLFSTDYYRLLNIQRTASKIEVKQAYLTLAKKYHPDTPTGNEELFKSIAEAYAVLSDDSKRSAFDSSKTSTASDSSYRKSGPKPKRDERKVHEETFKKYWREASNPWGGKKTPNASQEGYKGEEGPMAAIFDMLAIGSLSAIFIGIIYYSYKIGKHFMNPEPEPQYTSPNVTLKVPVRKAIDLSKPAEQQQVTRVTRSKFNES